MRDEFTRNADRAGANAMFNAIAREATEQSAEPPALKDRFSQWAIVLHEPLPPRQPATARYLDPLVYPFRTETSGSHEPCLIMAVQFKTTPSGDPHNIEATRMARGLMSNYCAGWEQTILFENYISGCYLEGLTFKFSSIGSNSWLYW